MRSGNHYLRALIGVNFLHRPINAWGDGACLEPAEGKKRFPGQHFPVEAPGVKKHLSTPDIRALYIWRDFEPVSKSMFALGLRMGIPKETTLEEFQNTPWKEMTSAAVALGEKWEIERLVLNDPKLRKEIHKGYTGSYKHGAWDSDMTPRAYWQHHVEDWLAEADKRENIHVVRYEELIENLDEEMNKIASFIGVEIDTFTDVEELVSMNPVRRTRCPS